MAQSLFRGTAGARALKDLNLSPPSLDLPKAAFIGLGVGLALFLAYETIPALTAAAAVAAVI